MTDSTDASGRCAWCGLARAEHPNTDCSTFVPRVGGNGGQTFEHDASPECVAGTMKQLETGAKPDFTLLRVRVKDCWNDPIGSKGFIIGWETVSAGYGELTIFVNEDDELKCDAEGMGRGFLHKVMAKLVDELPLPE